MGDLYLITNRYREAEDFYSQAHKADPNFNGNADLFKAAMARAMMGDLPAADDLDKQYILARTAAHDPNAPFKQPEWLWLTGRHKQALTELQAYARTAESRQDRSAATRAYAGIAIWDLMANDRPRPRRSSPRRPLHSPSSLRPGRRWSRSFWRSHRFPPRNGRRARTGS